MAGNRRQKGLKKAEAERLVQRYDSFMTFLALLALTIAPIVFHMIRQEFVAPSITNTTTADSGSMSDVFTHYKMVIYYALSALLILVFWIKLLTLESVEFRLTRIDAALAALCFLLLVSCIVSQYRSIAFNGFIYMLDGTGVHLCYCVLFFFGFHVFSKSPLRKWMYAPLFVSGLVNATLTLMNFMGVKLIDTAIIKVVLGVPANAVATNASAFTSTFGNINYLSGFGGVLFAIFFTRLVFSRPSLRPAQPAADAAPVISGGSRMNSGAVSTSRQKYGAPRKIANAPSSKAAAEGSGGFNFSGFISRIEPLAAIQNIMSFIMVAAAFIIVITSMSSSGFFTTLVMIPIILVFAALSGVTVRKFALAASSLAVCALIYIPISAADETVFRETFGLFGEYASFGVIKDDTPDFYESAGSSLSSPAALSDAQSLRLSPDESFLKLSANDPFLTLSVNEPFLKLSPDESFLTLSVNDPFLKLSANDEYSLDFNLPDYYPDAGVSPGTGRLYIWKETLKLVTKKPLVGYGMDTLSYTFPQNDLEKIAGLGSYAIYVTKPHNVFIGYAYGAGVPALIVFLIFNAFGAMAFLGWFISRRKSAEPPDLLILCAHLGWAAYLVQAFVNDDLISTAPLWWALFGTGAGMIYSAMRKPDIN